MVLGGAMDRRPGQRAIKGDEAPVVRDRQGQEVGVGDLMRAVQPKAIYSVWVEHADVAGPELVVTAVARSTQQLDGLRGGTGLG